ncbi:TPA: superinfection exclusion B family protein, partial [Escherichia coli]|nr:superinfection exclusion B family protein [Escherichia coli]
RAHIQKHYSLLPEQRVLLRLSEKEIAVFKDFLKTGNLIITSPCRNPVMKKLERKGIIQHQSDSANCSYYLVTEKYSHFMKLFWNSRSRRFNR